mgnify:CR=1 FL=1
MESSTDRADLTEHLPLVGHLRRPHASHELAHPRQEHLARLFVADICLLQQKTKHTFLRPKIPTKNLHAWGLGEADRAEI